MRYISSQTERQIRFVGLSTAIANSADLADWLAIKPQVRGSCHVEKRLHGCGRLNHKP